MNVRMRGIAIAEIGEVLLGRDLADTQAAGVEDRGVADRRGIGLDVAALERRGRRAAVADRQELVVLALDQTEVAQDRPREAHLRAVGGADADGLALEIGRRLIGRLLAYDQAEHALREVIVDEDDVDPPRARRQDGRGPGQPDLRLAGGHGLKHRRRAVDRLDIDREALLLEVALADRDP